MDKKRTDPNWAKLREALWARSGGRCEVSGRPLDLETFDAHHRRLRGMGGTNRPLTDSLHNLLALDPEVHNGAPWSVHQNSKWSRPRGYLLSAHMSDDVMACTPVLYHGTTWVVLDGAGFYSVLSERAQQLKTAKLTGQASRPRGSQYR